MAISDDRQRSMPSMADRDNAKILAYKEAVLLTNPRNPMFKGEVYILWFIYTYTQRYTIFPNFGRCE